MLNDSFFYQGKKIDKTAEKLKLEKYNITISCDITTEGNENQGQIDWTNYWTSMKLDGALLSLPKQFTVTDITNCVHPNYCLSNCYISSDSKFRNFLRFNNTRKIVIPINPI